MDRNRQQVSGSLECADRQQALKNLLGKGLQVFEINQTGSTPTAKAPAAKTDAAPVLQNRKLKGKDVMMFAEELSSLLDAGLRLERALVVMEGQDLKEPHQWAAKKVGDSIREGHNFATALRRTSPAFGQLFCAVAQAGEAGGSLGQSMSRLAAYLKQTQEMREKVIGALVYPGFLLASGLAVGALFVGYLIPKLTGFLGRGAMPPSVAWMVDASTFLRTWWWALLLGLVVLGLALWQYFRTPPGAKNWDAIRGKLPVVGPILKSGFQTEYLETLASLTGGGLPILTALDLARDVTSSEESRAKLIEAQDRIRDGAPLYRSLERTGLFTPRMIELIRMGDHTGDLTGALKSASDRAAAELNKRLQRMAALMQPVVTIFMAGMVGIMAWLMITVIFDTISALRNT